jgi:hypothetical protein
MLEDVTNLGSFATQTRTVSPVEAPPKVPMTQTSLGQLTDQAGALRSYGRVLQDELEDAHQQLRAHLLAHRSERVKLSSVQLLEEISDLGFAWRHIATMVGVSVPAVQKWRKGDRVAPENFERLAGLLSVCDLLKENFAVSDPASWFEVRLLPEVPVRPMDLFSLREDAALLDWASHHEPNAEKILDKSVPGWRQRYDSAFEVFTAPDGEPALRLKDR